MMDTTLDIAFPYLPSMSTERLLSLLTFLELHALAVLADVDHLELARHAIDMAMKPAILIETHARPRVREISRLHLDFDFILHTFISSNSIPHFGKGQRTIKCVNPLVSIYQFRPLCDITLSR